MYGLFKKERLNGKEVQGGSSDVNKIGYKYVRDIIATATLLSQSTYLADSYRAFVRLNPCHLNQASDVIIDMANIVLWALDYVRERLEKSTLLYVAKRTIFPVIVGVVIFSALLISSTLAYYIFYWSYIPSIGITKDVYLQFRFVYWPN